VAETSVAKGAYVSEALVKHRSPADDPGPPPPLPWVIEPGSSSDILGLPGKLIRPIATAIYVMTLDPWQSGNIRISS